MSLPANNLVLPPPNSPLVRGNMIERAWYTAFRNLIQSVGGFIEPQITIDDVQGLNDQNLDIATVDISNLSRRIDNAEALINDLTLNDGPSSSDVFDALQTALIALEDANNGDMLRIPQIFTVSKNADTARASTTALTNDPDLVTTTLKAGTYNLEAYLAFFEVTSGAGGFKFDLQGGTATLPSTNYGSTGWDTGGRGNAAITNLAATTMAAISTSNTAASWLLVKGQVTLGTDGTLALRWAQVASSANATTLMARSYMTLTRI